MTIARNLLHLAANLLGHDPHVCGACARRCRSWAGLAAHVRDEHGVTS